MDLDRFLPYPVVGSRSTNGGYCGPAVNPIALHMVAALARDRRITVPISGIGGISTCRDAAEFIALGATSVQVCTAAMHYGFRIVEDMIDGLGAYLDDKGMKSVRELHRRALPAFVEWGDLDLNYKVVAHVDAEKCIGCNLCYVACRDTAVHCIHNADEPLAPGHRASTREAARAAAKARDAHVVWVDESECIGCNLCSAVCPVGGCITMKDVTGDAPFESWNDRIADRVETATASLPAFRFASDERAGIGGAQAVGVGLLLRRGPGGGFEPVPLETVFRPGDAITLELAPRSAGYLRVAEQRDDGSWNIVYPSEGSPGSQFLAVGPVNVPSTGAWDVGIAGVGRRLFVIYTPEPQTETIPPGAIRNPERGTLFEVRIRTSR